VGAKVFAWLSLIIIGGMLADAIAHPAGTAAVGSVFNSTLGTAGNIVGGVTTNKVGGATA
jgi:uncharacterized membrane protein YeaQ/YmgE (transglycosylase-associated protein family)